MNPARLCIRRPVATAMVILSHLVLGGLSARLLPLEMLPSIDEPILFINIPYPGSTPQETERLITRPAEEALATLKGVRIAMVDTLADVDTVADLQRLSA